MRTLIIQTDFDFSIRHKGKVYMGYDFLVKDFESPDDIEVLGPWGHGEASHRYEIDEALDRIRREPDVSFDTTGGNRGVTYYAE